jgi:hypothetical protein
MLLLVVEEVVEMLMKDMDLVVVVLVDIELAQHQ